MPNFIIIRRIQQRPNTTVQRALEHAWDRRWGRSHSMQSPIWRPQADIHEYTNEYVIKVELAGMRDSDIEVSIDDNVLTIQGVRHETRSETITRIHELSINYGQFQLDFALNAPIQSDAVIAQYDDGMLFVTLPKQTYQPAQSRRIPLNLDETNGPKQ